MTARDSNLRNAFRTQLTAQMGPTDTTATVGSSSGMTSPGYMVIDPRDGQKREYIYFDGAFTATAFVTSTTVNRYLSGSAAVSGITHDIGAEVWCVPMAQHFEDLHDRIDAVSTAGGVTNTPAGSIAATTVQAAINELDTEKAPIGSPTFTGTVTLPGDPSSDLVAADKRYVDINTAAKRVRVVATTNGTLATAYANGQTVDGVTLATGDRILLAGQTSGADNGIRVVAASGAPARAGDFDTSAKALSGMLVTVSEGTVYHDSVWQLTTNAAITLDTTALVFSRVPGMVAVSKGGSAVGTRPAVNFIEGTNVTMTVADDSANDRVNVTINASGGGGYGTFDVTQLKNSVSQSILNGTETALTFDLEDYDTSSQHSTVSSTDQVVIAATGDYDIDGQASFVDSGTTGDRLVEIKNGIVVLSENREQGSTANPHAVVVPVFTVACTIGDVIRLYAYETSGSSMSVAGEAQGKRATFLRVRRAR